MDSYWVCDGCYSLNRERDNRCYHCRSPKAASGQASQAAASSRPVSSAAQATAASASSAQTASYASSSGWRSAASGDAPAGSGGGIARAMSPTAALGAPALGAPAVPGFAAMSGPAAATIPGMMPVDAAGSGSAPAGADETSLLGALILGTGAAMAATALWFGVVSLTHYEVGFIAIGVGWLVAQGVVWGGGGRGSVALIPISVVLTFLALAASEYLIVVKIVGDLLTESGYAYTLDLIQPPDVVLEAIGISIRADPITLVFWGIAIVESFLVPLRRLARAR